jgi:hypothetical protein
VRSSGSGKKVTQNHQGLELSHGIQMGTPEFKCRPLLAGIFRDGKVYKKAGVMVSGIVPKTSCSTTLSLFEEEAPAANVRDVKLMKIKHTLLGG